MHSELLYGRDCLCRAANCEVPKNNFKFGFVSDFVAEWGQEGMTFLKGLSLLLVREQLINHNKHSSYYYY
jgi:hypothetical protein